MAKASGRGRVFRLAFGVVAALVVTVLFAPAALVVLYRKVPPPPTPLMILRGPPTDYRWVPLKQISPALERSVVASEDEAFCTHHGFDRTAIARAWERYIKVEEEGRGTIEGGSTISQQTAKNLFLWPARSWLRKALEAWLTVYLETFWDKHRIIEVYLNVVEWAPGVYGAEAAARHHFHESAAVLDPHQAALLAAVLPNPRHWSASNPGPYVRARADAIEERAAKLGAFARCF